VAQEEEKQDEQSGQVTQDTAADDVSNSAGEDADAPASGPGTSDVEVDEAAGPSAGDTAAELTDDTGADAAVESAEPAGADEGALQSADEATGQTDKGLDGGEAPVLPDFSEEVPEAARGDIERLKDVELNVKIELGRARMTVDEVLHLTNGSVVELAKLAGDAVDILVNEQLVACGEVLVVNDNFCVRINEIIPGATEAFAAHATR